MDVPYDLGDDHRLVDTLCPDMKVTLERPDPDIATAVTGAADLSRVGRGLLLHLVERAKARDAAAEGTGRGNTITAPHGQGGHRRMAHPARRLCSAWALLTGQDLDATTLVRVLGAWLGQPA
ncbi:hypothetical protein [Streptomyces dubilierae]|uniref:Uncharacterized protein n=1 Tax=Streptomyces dubilierae TaxID=3075533 RepID=A0ABU2P2U4_9ACTN|nr:hypothetical protein [Streptomyces sp. DSM 41921]MDT0386073.1 hypothetical protein [Streptomyces sp. DSM 41921]